MQSPVGDLALACDGVGLTHVLFVEEAWTAPPGWERDDEALATARSELAAYFAGRRTSFEVPLSMHGTEFQQRVWNGLRTIPFGATVSYGSLAARIGKPDAVRAVGAANGRNPLAIVVPCHRVIGADASLTGYGGGMARKKWLLEFERDIASSRGLRVESVSEAWRQPRLAGVD